MENSLKGLSLAAGIIITCIVISLGFYIAREASDTASLGAGQISKLNAEFSDASLTIYDGTEISGSEVVNVIRKSEEDTVGILVMTAKTTTYYIHEFDPVSGEILKTASTSYKSARDASSENYINPTGRFEGTVVRDINGTITGLVFLQK